MFPKYLPMIIFSLEYIRKMISSEKIHFVVDKKKCQFIIKIEIRPFICNNREASEKTNIFLRQMEFPLRFTWSYEPFGIISELRNKQNTTPYVHT
jgi:hypothetical protein